MYEMDSLNIAILVIVVLILLYLFPVARGYVSSIAPWAILLGGALVVGALLVAPGDQRFTGGADDDFEESDVFDFEENDAFDESDENAADLTIGGGANKLPARISDYIVDRV